MELTEKEILYQAVFWYTLFTFAGVSVVAGAFLTILAFAQEKGLALVAGGFTALVTILGSPGVGYWRANAAVAADWEQAIDDKATYFEKLHGVWTGYEVIRHDCAERDNDMRINNTGCEYVTVDSYCASYDEEGCDDTDYRFKPWFDYEESLTADLNVFKNGHVTFASHLAPEDWRSAEWHLPFYRTPGTDFAFERPHEWLRIKLAIDSGYVLPGTVWNQYKHWVYSDEFGILKTFSPDIPFYRDLGLLPRINMIHDSAGTEVTTDIKGNLSGLGYDYDAVQFLQMYVDPTTYQQWQETAALWHGMAGPTIQSSLILFFALSEQIDNPYQWVHTAKANLMVSDENDSGYGRYVLPKNAILIGCGVSADLTTIEWCEGETGMFAENERFISDIQKTKPFPFTPQAVFGTASFVPALDFTGGTIDQVIRDGTPGHGFHRVEMEKYAHKRATIKLTPEEIGAIRSANLFKALLSGLGLWGLVFAGIFTAARRA